ncbi:MAG: zinc-ribbon domain containing protein [Thermoanaerobacteraceae bacterium]|uniref:Zinc-binding protein n=1 Tax=Desulfofundulus thermobenzoicus TaxID=29376 RepID=A0A6N7IP18_9FIRM|nr:zinc-ribbon domain containing protein [Desulfofundulus thermobenzoicus]MBE3587165.1 zinc-ribbon domain containing protein [Thermoanaerobacteraceae bacterium]MQL51775.1 zinc-binding protein [Desulfofundulus thermobenzoicus]HHW44720.1 zinc-binding protein [Desulfotomaculum sp.]
MSYEDKVLTCRDCGAEFIFSAGEQAFYAEKGLTNEPTRCRDCRRQRKQQRNGFQGAERQMYDAFCSACGAPTQVPFKPTGRKPIYCRECMASNRRMSYR